MVTFCRRYKVDMPYLFATFWYAPGDGASQSMLIYEDEGLWQKLSYFKSKMIFKAVSIFCRCSSDNLPLTATNRWR